MRFLLHLAAIVTAAVIVAACDEKLSDLTGPTPNLAPTLSSIQREIFDQTDSSGRLACVRCHNGTTPFLPGLMNLTSGNAYRSLVGVRSTVRPGETRVIPGDPANSYLIRKLRGGPNIVGGRMPLSNGPFLTEGQVQVIERWIEVGAPNN
jgi:hypothetical protein